MAKYSLYDKNTGDYLYDTDDIVSEAIGEWTEKNEEGLYQEFDMPETEEEAYKYLKSLYDIDINSGKTNENSSISLKYYKTNDSGNKCYESINGTRGYTLVDGRMYSPTGNPLADGDWKIIEDTNSTKLSSKQKRAIVNLASKVKNL